MGNQSIKPNYRRRVLQLPDLDHCKSAVLNSLGSPASRRVYEYAIDQFIAWYCSEPRLAFNRIVVVRYRMYLESRGLAGAREEIAARYSITAANGVGFEVATYDASRPLPIDPLIYSTFLGGSGEEQGFGMTVDSAGSAYVTGYTVSTNFPTESPLQPSNSGGQDAFVTKFNAAGSALVYSTYLGGGGNEVGFGIAVDSVGDAYIAGVTTSTDFPMLHPLQPSYGGGTSDAFVAKITG